MTMSGRMAKATWAGVVLLLASTVSGQDGKPAEGAERLRALLLELAGIDATAWTARLAQLEAQAKAADARGAELRAQAAKLVTDAEGADADAKRVRAEIERLKQLQALAAGLTKPASTAPAPADPTKTEPTKPEPPKAEPPKAEPPKAAAMAAAPVAAPAPDIVLWEHVAPIFTEHCASCHDPDEKKGGLDLTSFAAARQGGGSGQTIVPGEPEQSRLYRLVTRQERPFMPRGADPLPAATLAKLKLWIEQGASDDAAAARAFAARQQEAALAAASASTGDAASDADGMPMPEGLPVVELRKPARDAAVKSLARSPRAALLALPGLQQVRLLDADLTPVGVLPCPLEVVASVTFSADGRQLLAAGGDPGRRGRAILYDVRSGKQLGEFGVEKDVPLAAAVDARRGLVALGGSSKQVRVHRTTDGTLAFAGKHDDFVLGLAFSRDGAWLAAADRSGTIQVWDTKTGRVEQTLTGHRGAVHAVAFLANGKLLASVGADGIVRTWDVADGKEKWRQTAHQGEALAVAVGPDDAIATCGSDGRIKLFTSQGRERGASPALGEWLYTVAFGADGKTVFAGDWLGRTHRLAVK